MRPGRSHAAAGRTLTAPEPGRLLPWRPLATQPVPRKPFQQCKVEERLTPIFFFAEIPREGCGGRKAPRGKEEI